MVFTHKACFMVLIGLALILSCSNAGAPDKKGTHMKVVATIFPLYDFACKIGGGEG